MLASTGAHSVEVTVRRPRVTNRGIVGRIAGAGLAGLARMRGMSDILAAPSDPDRLGPVHAHAPQFRSRLLAGVVLPERGGQQRHRTDGLPARGTRDPAPGNPWSGSGAARWSRWRWCRRCSGSPAAIRCISIPGAGACPCTWLASVVLVAAARAGHGRLAQARLTRMPGRHYDFGDWPRELFYEYLKDCAYVRGHGRGHPRLPHAAAPAAGRGAAAGRPG